MQVCYLIEHLLSSLELPTCDNGELNYLAPGEAYASLIIIQISIVECHLGLESHHNHTPLAHWITINLSIHHRRCHWFHQDFLLNEELGCANAPFLSKIFFECPNPLFDMSSLYCITGPKGRCMLQGPRLCTEFQRGAAVALSGHAKGQEYLHTTTPHQGELMQGNWPWLLGIVSFSPAHHPKISPIDADATVFVMYYGQAIHKWVFPRFEGQEEREKERWSMVV